MDHEMYNRKRHMVLALIQEHPDLEAAIADTDEEGAQFYGQTYIPGVDFMVETLDASLALEPFTYRRLRQQMMPYPSMALQN
jgi:hypothetical protein